MTAPKIYIDSCCLIEAIKKQRGLPLSHPLSEVDMIERIMLAAREDEVELHTSIITLAEVVHLGETPPPADLKPYVERLILSGRNGIRATAPTPQIVLLARDLAAEENILGRVGDRIHIATAMTVGVPEFVTSFPNDWLIQTCAGCASCCRLKARSYQRGTVKMTSSANRPKTKQKVTPDDPEQSKRFVEAAKAAEADETPKGAEKAFKAVVKPRKAKIK